ncbi:hypothetical protein [Mycolicibacterium conceptionense]|uniref:hypothetical protein n=1 Tax=Mycolicibacterium conceptionense TaxID=451644 RepID=UPI001AD808DD|nr:hypothetical protein [Mycolicibacterium conceptionense]
MGTGRRDSETEHSIPSLLSSEIPVSYAAMHEHRARVAALTRSRTPDDPALLDARAKMREEALVNAIERALAKAPPLTHEVRSRIVGLLSPEA